MQISFKRVHFEYKNMFIYFHNHLFLFRFMGVLVDAFLSAKSKFSNSYIL